MNYRELPQAALDQVYEEVTHGRPGICPIEGCGKIMRLIGEHSPKPEVYCDACHLSIPLWRKGELNVKAR